jgi:hypothetical protein
LARLLRGPEGWRFRGLARGGLSRKRRRLA